MADLWRMRVTWSAPFAVGAGVSTFHFLPDTPGLTAAVTAFFDGIKGNLVTGQLITIPNTGDIIETSTGQPKGIWTQGAVGTKSGTGGVNYAAGVGARVVWGTNGWNNGRRVKGSTYLVPLSAGEYEADGTIKSTTVLSASIAAQALVTALGGGMQVYSHRPGTAVGTLAAVTTGALSDKVSWLRSRRT